jgi:uncharacterized protein
MTSPLGDTETSKHVVREMYRVAVGEDGFEQFTKLVSPDLVIHEPDYLPYGGDYAGVDAVGPLFVAIDKYFVSAETELLDVVADGPNAVAFVRIPERGSGEWAHVLEHLTVLDGKITEIRVAFQSIHHLAR